MSIWDKFDKEVDLEALNKDINDVKDNKREFTEVPEGNYEVKITNMELKQSKKGDPMLSIYMKIIAGKYENQYLFYNQVVTKGFGIHMASEFLRSLDTKTDVKFERYSQFDNLINDIFDDIENEELEYQVEFSKNNKGFSVFNIKEVYTK